MATYNFVYVLTRYASLSNAKKKEPKVKFLTGGLGKVYKNVWTGAMRGKIKDFIIAHKVAEQHHDENWNGFGYQDKYNDYFMSAADGKMFLELTGEKKAVAKSAKTWEQMRDAWAKRLVRLLAGVEGYEWVTFDAAIVIAEEKNDYKRQQIEKVESRQYESYSAKRAKLIRKMERENPLRRIEDMNHAIAIIQASHRHNDSNYEQLLDKYRHDAELGLIDRREVKEMARTNMNY